MTPAEALRAWRGNHSAKEAAKALGVSVRTYQGWEQGRGPSGSTLALLLKIIAAVEIAK